jgi:hypothetical protein
MSTLRWIGFPVRLIVAGVLVPSILVMYSIIIVVALVVIPSGLTDVVKDLQARLRGVWDWVVNP